MRHTLLSILLFLSLASHSQDMHGKASSTPPAVYTYVEQMPAPGYDLPKYLNEHLKYPDSAYNANIQGRVIVRFVVNEDGSASDCTVLKGIGGGCDEAAVKVITTMPAWQAGVKAGKKVKVYMTLPISFTLDEKKPEQKVVSKKKELVVYNTIDQPPYPEYSVRNYFADNFHCKESFDAGLVRFIVNEDGSISDPFVVSGIDIGCRAEIYRVLKSMPHWKPGKQNGQPARVYWNMRVRFLARTGDIRIENI